MERRSISTGVAARSQRDGLSRCVMQLEAAHARQDAARICELATMLDRRARAVGAEPLADACRRLRAADARLPERELGQLVSEAAREARRTLDWLRVWSVLHTPPPARSPVADRARRAA